MPVIAIIDYDMGNLHSVCKGLEMTGSIPKVTHDPKEIATADGVVLPGVGAFDPAMRHLRSRQLISPILDVIASGKPFLGIRLGLQILFDGSEEGQESGLGVISGIVRRFMPEPGLTIPHMGWNQLQVSQPHLPVWKGLKPDSWVYFVHSYHGVPTDVTLVAATTTHGSQQVTAAIAYAGDPRQPTNQNLVAVQFHPEKSAHQGLQILSNFVNGSFYSQLPSPANPSENHHEPVDDEIDGE